MFIIIHRITKQKIGPLFCIYCKVTGKEMTQLRIFDYSTHMYIIVQRVFGF